MKFASLCVLSYKRPERLRECVNSLLETADYPFELIVNCDGNDELENIDWLVNLQRNGGLSKLLISGGKNRGVGRSFANCVGMAEGEYVFKIDTDLTFKPHWLSTAVNILENNEDVASVSLFNYRNYDPNDTRFNTLEERKDCLIVDDFVSSIYGIHKTALDLNFLWRNDDGYHSSLKDYGKKLAITKEDYVTNHGFGVTKSTYVSGTEDHPFKTPTHPEPLLFSTT